MRSKIYHILFLCLAFIFFTSCKKDKIVTGWKPVYMSKDSLHTIRNLAPQPIINSGSIYSWNNYLFVNEQYKGIHVIDQTNPANAINISFIQIWGNKNFTVYDNVLYADNGSDLITIDISDVLHVTVLDIQEGAVGNSKNYPDSSGYFECVDHSKGIITSWEKTTLINPKCMR
jgi:hypothetical protein